MLGLIKFGKNAWGGVAVEIYSTLSNPVPALYIIAGVLHHETQNWRRWTVGRAAPVKEVVAYILHVWQTRDEQSRRQLVRPEVEDDLADELFHRRTCKIN